MIRYSTVNTSLATATFCFKKHLHYHKPCAFAVLGGTLILQPYKAWVAAPVEDKDLHVAALLDASITIWHLTEVPEPVFDQRVVHM